MAANLIGPFSKSIYVPVYRGSTWTQAWALREFLTYDYPTVHSWSDRVCADRTDAVHFVSETFNIPNTSYPSVQYRRRGQSNWGTGYPTIVAGDAAAPWGGYPCTSTTPNIFIQETAVADTVHMEYARNEGEDPCPLGNVGYMCYTRKPLNAPDNAWEPESFVTKRIQDGSIAVDSEGTVHFVGTAIKNDINGLPDSSFVWAVRGRPPTPGSIWSDTTFVLLGKYKLPSDFRQAQASESGEGVIPQPALLTEGDYVYATWEGTVLHLGVRVRETFLGRFSVANHQWSDSVRVTPDDGNESDGGYGGTSAGSLSIAPNGTLHLLYTDPMGARQTYQPTDSSRVYHRYNSGNPLSPGDWSLPTEISVEKRRSARRGALVATDDSVWVAYQCRDNDDTDPIDDRFAVWGHTGHAIGSSVTSGHSETLSGIVYLDRDFLVEAGATLTIAAGTRIIALANTDLANVGVDPGRVELIVRGRLQVDGDVANLVRFESTEHGEGHWHGIVFDAAAEPESRVVNALIRNHERGIVVMNAGTPELLNVTFANGEVADIYFDRDVRIPEGTSWVLTAPTRVVALADNTTWDDPLGTPNVCDLIVLGALGAQRPVGADPGSMVVFESTAKDSVNGNDWGGITIGTGGLGMLQYSDVGFAKRPFYFAGAAFCQLTDSHVHHYSEDGIFCYATDALIERCMIERGANLHPDTLTTAVHSLDAVPTIRDNEIEWQTGYGILVGFSRSWCMFGLPWAPEDTLRVVGNRITGDGGDIPRPASAAIRAEYLCQHHAGLVEADTVTAWTGPGIELFQSADVRVACSVVEDNIMGVQYTRDGTVLQEFEGSVDWRQNSLKRSRIDNVRVDSPAPLLRLFVFDEGSAAGQNSLQRKYSVQTSKNIRLQGAINGHLDATHASWLDEAGNVITDVATVNATNLPGFSNVIAVDPLLSSEQLCSTSGASRQRMVEVAVGSEDHARTETGSAEQELVPESWALNVTGPNPSTGNVSFVVAVPTAAQVAVAVYDVAGRRVRALRDRAMDAGFHRLTWDRTREGGSRVIAGVYFLRVEGNGFRATRKLVLR